jgi:hypothetical protein
MNQSPVLPVQMTDDCHPNSNFLLMVVTLQLQEMAYTVQQLETDEKLNQQHVGNACPLQKWAVD